MKIIKIIKIIIIYIILSLSFSISLVNADSSETELNLKNLEYNDENDINKSKLDLLKDREQEFIGISGPKGEEGIKYVLFDIAKSLKNIFFFIAGLYFLILVLKLIVIDNTEEQIDKFKKGVIWISIGIIITQVSYSFVNVLFNESISEGLSKNFIDIMIYPFIDLLQTGAAFFFIAIAIYAFFRSVSANGDEEKVKTSRMSILYSLIGLVVIKVAEVMVDTIYGKISCDTGPFSTNNCTKQEDLDGAVQVLAGIINWVNGFVGIILIILIIYTGFQLIFSFGNEEKVSKAKKSIIYIIAGFTLLFINYLILTFFIIPE